MFMHFLSLTLKGYVFSNTTWANQRLVMPCDFSNNIIVNACAERKQTLPAYDDCPYCSFKFCINCATHSAPHAVELATAIDIACVKPS